MLNEWFHGQKRTEFSATGDGFVILPGLAAAIFQKFQDDAPEMARRQLALLELSQAGANLVEFTHFMSQQLGQDQDVPKSSLADMAF